MALEHRPLWARILTELRTASPRAVAARHAVPLWELTEALRRTGANVEAAVPPRPVDVRLEEYEHLIGQLPDREVATLADVPLHSVFYRRVRRGIPAAHGRVGPPRSSVAGVHDRLGREPDRVLAAALGVPTTRVVRYRQSRGITLASTEPSAAPAPAPAAPAPPPPVAATAEPLFAWIARVHRDGAAREYVVVAPDVARAAATAVRAVGAAGEVLAVRYVAKALG